MGNSEPLTNMGPVCEDHAPRPLGLTAMVAPGLIGKYVKLGFPTMERPPDVPWWPPTEHMWVRVERFDGEKLVGTLNNDSYFTDVKFGAEITFTVEEVEAVGG